MHTHTHTQKVNITTKYVCIYRIYENAEYKMEIKKKTQLKDLTQQKIIELL